ncbi:MAG: hypothetical protein ACXVDD_09605 [Polyangia bacterium]
MAVPKVKGANVLAAVKMLRAHRDRAVALLPAQHQHYLDERILVSSWYPEADQLELLRAVSFLLPGTPDPWMMIGRIAARGDLSDLYRNMVRPGDLKDALRASSSLWRTFHDTGELKLTLEEPGRVKAVLRGYATAREMCRVIGGYVTEVATVAAGREIKTVKLGCTLDGASECSWRMTWR